MHTCTGGLVVKKQEMTRLWVENRFVAVTLIMPLPQTVIRHKTAAVDGYNALVISAKTKGKNTEVCEFRGDESLLQNYPVGAELSLNLFEGATRVRVTGTSIGKGFQGVMKRHNFSGGPKTHGSKFHRAGGSTGNRKPRRTHKGHPMAGRMGGDTITLRSVPVVSKLVVGEEQFLAVKGSLPGHYGSLLKVML